MTCSLPPQQSGLHGMKVIKDILIRGDTLQLKVPLSINRQGTQPGVYLVGFKAEYGCPRETGGICQGRMRGIRSDLMGANDVLKPVQDSIRPRQRVLVDDEVWTFFKTKEEISALVVGRIIERII